MSQVISGLVFLSFSLSALGAKYPTEIPKCKRTDGECMAKSVGIALATFKDGRPDLGIPRLEPFNIPKIEFAGSGKAVTLSQSYKNVKVYGIYDSSVPSFSMNFENGNCEWDFKALSPTIRLEADYQLNGKLLVFPVNSEGRCNITVHNLLNHHQLKCERYEKKGKTYIRVTDYKEDLQPDAVDYVFTRLFPGNEKIAKDIQKTIDENSLEIFKEVKGGFETVWNEMHKNAANAIFSRFPEEDLFLK